MKIKLDCGNIRTGSKVLFKWDYCGKRKTIYKGIICENTKQILDDTYIYIWADDSNGNNKRFLAKDTDIIKRIKY